MSTTKKSSGAKKVSKKTTVKKASKKKVVKKTAKKVTKKAVKKTTKKTSQKLVGGDKKVLVCAKDKECFWTNDGKILKDLNELNEALNAMSDDVFAHHVTKERNDFADWVEAVLADAECASALRRARRASSAQTVVVRHLKFYSY